ncbi:MAG: division/cell wall cluster transcriptional repressor MraZ [Acidobacteria bacterium]|nr:division/cell wall cluster transcriptional repressor MraZ [Acidobacteriota bacterium]
MRGNSPATIDRNGRLKIPNEFRRIIEVEYGRDLFVTSLSGENVRIYPLAVWTAIEKKLAQMSSTHPARVRFLDRVNFFGQLTQFDAQGRVVVHPRVRESAHMAGEVDVLGNYNYLEVWNHERFVGKLQREPFTDDDARALADFGI